MEHRKRKWLAQVAAGFCLVTLTVSCTQGETKTGDEFRLWYDRPANEWMESLPVGNGRLGAMVYGGVDEEKLALNESTLWGGEYDETQQRPFGREKLDHLRKLVFEGKLAEANDIAGREMNGTSRSFGTHLPMGDLKIRFIYEDSHPVTDYCRELDLQDAVCRTTYRRGDVTYSSQCIASNPDEVIVWNVTASRPEALNMDISLALLRNAEIHTEGNDLVYTGDARFPLQGEGGVKFEGRVTVKAKDGVVEPADTLLRIRKATEVTLLTDIRTDFRNTTFAGYDYSEKCRTTLAEAGKHSFKELLKRHVADYAPLFARVNLSLGTVDNKDIPTDERWRQLRAGGTDPALSALFFQYARYLLIASSRPDSPLPVALQGFFNDNLACYMGWTNDYHLDINTEQNYWIANVGNLAECNLPLFDYIRDLSVHGSKTARDLYGCQGWTAHTTANPWGYTAVSTSIAWGLFPTASSWMASHLWTQYEYTLDRDYLAKTAYPLLKGNARFLLDYMVEDPSTGYLLTGPSISPENSFRFEGRELGASMMPTVDRVLAQEIFNACLRSTEILDTDPLFADSLRQALKKLPPLRIGANGGVQEWMEDYEEAHPNHRHTSHLLSLYPFSQITPEETPELATAARCTIELRLATPDWEDTEWSRANMICMYARLRDAEAANASVHQLLTELTRENLLSISPAGIAGAPYDIFIFDGNAAGAAGIAEMLLQSHDDCIRLLPALPIEWKEGSYKGLCARGGLVVDACWKEGRLESGLLRATVPADFRLQLVDGGRYTLRINGEVQTIRPDVSNCFRLSLKKGDVVEIAGSNDNK